MSQCCQIYHHALNCPKAFSNYQGTSRYDFYKPGRYQLYNREWVVIPVPKSEKAHFLAYVIHRIECMKMLMHTVTELAPDHRKGFIEMEQNSRPDLFAKYVSDIEQLFKQPPNSLSIRGS